MAVFRRPSKCLGITLWARPKGSCRIRVGEVIEYPLISLAFLFWVDTLEGGAP